MMEGACQSCIKQLIESKTLADQAKIASVSTAPQASQSQSTSEHSFSQFQQESNNLKDWRAFKQNFHEEKSMECQFFVLSSTKPVGQRLSERKYKFQAQI